MFSPPDPFSSGLETSRGEALRLCLERARDPDGEGARVYTRLYAGAAEIAALASEARRRVGQARSPIDGMMVSIKDLFDVTGEATTAGSAALANEPAATRDADVVARLRDAGAVLIGKTNMTEFAMSGLGLNPHFGTPRNPWRREEAYIPGGSSSGAAVSVSDGMADAAIGTDTGGSVRIPAAFCGLVGFKPTAARVSRRGAFSLATSLDSIGPIGRDVRTCDALDAVLSGEDDRPSPPSRPRLAVPRHYVSEGLDPAVAAAFEAAVRRVERAGARIVEIDFPELTRLPDLNAAGGFSPIEGFAAHAELFSRIADQADPRVMSRFLRGGEASARDYFLMLSLREALIDQARARTLGFDAVILPTVAIVPPRLQDLREDEAYYRINGLVIRNAAIANLLDRCAITVPCHDQGAAPVGFMMIGERAADRALLALATHLEAAIRSGLSS
jgi:aspartyl-tRNA(Asn)/glutamyl-tRNA(Gln) amidotransferase subunit A